MVELLMLAPAVGSTTVELFTVVVLKFPERIPLPLKLPVGEFLLNFALKYPDGGLTKAIDWLVVLVTLPAGTVVLTVDVVDVV